MQNGDEDWSVDVSDAAVQARSQNLSEHISTLALTNDAELPASQRLDKFFKFVEVSELEESLEQVQLKAGGTSDMLGPATLAFVESLSCFGRLFTV